MLSSRKNNAVTNAGIGLASQIFPLLLQFVCRQVFLRYLSVEYLGINGTFSSILDTLSLAEFGFQTAVVFSLYKPLKEGDKQKINSIVNILRIIYGYIGLFFILATIIITPFVGYFLSGIEITFNIYLFFVIQSLGVAASYFWAYKRTLLYADQKDYIAKTIDMVFNIIFVIIQIASLVIYKNFSIFLTINVFKVLVSNCFVHYYCTKLFPFLNKEKLNMQYFKYIFFNTKNIFVGKIAGYVYSSTDNIVISTCVNTLSVGLIANYKVVTQGILRISSGILTPIVPIIGNLSVDADNFSKKKIFETYTLVRFLIAAVALCPTLLLINDFIILWIGKQYLLNIRIVTLLIADIYIGLVYSSCCDFISVAGLFKQDRTVAIIGACINLLLSILLSLVLGIEGVLWGTIISQIWFWIARSNIAYRHCFGKYEFQEYIKYWINNILYTIIFLIAALISYLICNFLFFNISILSFILKGVLCVIVTIGVCLGLLWKNDSMAKLMEMFFKKSKF